jgi:hypothetical protein
LLHGETTSIGTRWPSPYGPAGFAAEPAKISPVVSTVDCPADAYGGTTWSKKPSFSS